VGAPPGGGPGLGLAAVSLAILLAAVMILTLAWTPEEGGSSVVSPDASAAGTVHSATSPALSTELNLLNGSTYVAPNLIYDGVYNTTNTTFPALLTGSSTSKFWSTGHPVMVMAPRVSYRYGHDSGLLMFPGGNGTAWDVGEVGVASPVFYGDGFSNYFLLNPVATSNWNSDYYATNPEGPYVSTPVCSGSVIFPYSTSPYIVVQWDPSYTVAYCGMGTTGAFNLYLVDPGAGGVVTASNVTSLGPVGSFNGPIAGNDDSFADSAGYSASTDWLSVTVLDEEDPTVDYQLQVDLATFGFHPTTASLPDSYLGVAAGGFDGTGWGLLYAGAYTTNGSIGEYPLPSTGTAPTTSSSGLLTTEALLEYSLVAALAVIVLLAVMLVWRRRPPARPAPWVLPQPPR
jgi:hypothetical protein